MSPSSHYRLSASFTVSPYLRRPLRNDDANILCYHSGELINGEMQKGSSGGSGAHKLGPKANQGAINAGLRALDRTGKPCRKWERKGFSVKSFTGVVWEVPTWRAPKKTVNLDANGEVKSDTSSEVKGENLNTSVLPSENGTSGSIAGTPLPMTGVASSPAPLAAA